MLPPDLSRYWAKRADWLLGFMGCLSKDNLYQIRVCIEPVKAR